MMDVSSRARVDQLLSQFDAGRPPHARGRTLRQHLLGTWAVLRAWDQPRYLCEAGAFHSVYGTDIYQRELLSAADRDRVRAAIGARAEGLVRLFSVMSRAEFQHQVETLVEIPSTGLDIACNGSQGVYFERATQEEVVALLLLIMANMAEQACTRDRGPSLWLARMNALALRVPSGDLPVPPVFDHCREFLSPQDESAARDAYRIGLAAMRKDPEEARSRLELAVALCPWVGEPMIWLAYLYCRQGETEEADRLVVQGWQVLKDWSVAWDKRLSQDQWLSVATQVFMQAGNEPAIRPLPPPDLRALERFPDDLRRGAWGQVFVGTGGGDEPMDPDARLQKYLGSFADNEHDPRMRFYPGLRTRPFHNAADFPLAQALTDNYEAIREELLALDNEGFFPESENIRRTGFWDVQFLFELGRKDEAVCGRCPVTTRVLEEHNALRTLVGLIYVSRLSPGTHVTAHCGPTNLRLRCHLGLQIPEGNCGIRVDGETRQWTQGGCVVFDDFLLHEAWNHTRTDRIVLIVDLWHPDLTPWEITVLEGMHRYAAGYADSLALYWRRNDVAREGRRKLLEGIPVSPVVPAREEDESAADYLRRLDSLGTFLFHGSPYGGIDVLELNWAVDEASSGSWTNDRAVYAVPAVIAVGRAILPARDAVEGYWNFSLSRDPQHPGGPLLSVSVNLELGTGSVYVLEKAGFDGNPALHEWKSRVPVPVLAEVRVTPVDFREMGGRVAARD